MALDLIQLRNLQLCVPLRAGARWPKPPTEPALQPLLISLDIFHDTRRTAATDKLDFSVNYSDLAKRLKNTAETHGPFDDIEHLCYLALDVFSPSEFSRFAIHVVQTRPPIHSDSIQMTLELEASPQRDGWQVLRKQYKINEISCDAILGVNDCERIDPQRIIVNLQIEPPTSQTSARQSFGFRGITSLVYEAVSKSAAYTVEALASTLSLLVLQQIQESNNDVDHLWTVSVDIAKPWALVFASFPRVQVRRTALDYPTEFSHGLSNSNKLFAPNHRAVLSVGSNQGDRFQNIEAALALLEGSDLQNGWFANVVDTSFLYETSPMYVLDQPSFINGAMVLETNMPPNGLLQIVKDIETAVGRMPTQRHGPRVIDLDLIFYDDKVIDTRPVDQRDSLDNLAGHLVIPHPRFQEREFVLRPLNDMIPDYRPPKFRKTIRQLLLDVDSDPNMRRAIPFPAPPTAESGDIPTTSTFWTFPIIPPPASSSSSVEYAPPRNTRIMATLNVTPDSFSDGMDHLAFNDALSYAKNVISSGSADILDVGGYSTRPGATFVSEEEESNRVSPIIRAIRETEKTLPISIDTFRPSVARSAVAAGANCINDVYAFTGPEMEPEEKSDSDVLMASMKSCSREFRLPVILMHSRGDAGKNKDYSEYAYAGKHLAVIEGVRVELGAKVERIVRGKGGVRRWLVIVDPGIGFSKTVEGNLEILRNAGALTADDMLAPISPPEKKDQDQTMAPSQNVALPRRNPLYGFPVLVGPSRKSFLGAILQDGPQGRETTPKERDWATAAAVACSVQQAALIVRVHDATPMADVVKVCDRIW